MNLLVSNLNEEKIENKIKFRKNNWNYSIDILVNLENLYLNDTEYLRILFYSLKCYTLTSDFFLRNIYLISDNENSFKIFFNINIKKIKKIKFYDFEIWLEDLLESEKNYIKNCKFIGFRINYYKESISLKENKIYPNFDIYQEFIKKIIF